MVLDDNPNATYIVLERAEDFLVYDSSVITVTIIEPRRRVLTDVVADEDGEVLTFSGIMSLEVVNMLGIQENRGSANGTYNGFGKRYNELITHFCLQLFDSYVRK